ncbi:MAG: hypothetical protein ACK5Q5_08445 [Planctomycetaceae bacterium]
MVLSVLHLRWLVAGLASLGALPLIGLFLMVRARNLQYWLKPYLLPPEPARPRSDDEPVDVFLAICDHYEPECYGASRETARARVARWVDEYPRAFHHFRDVNGRAPQHTFFFPQDEYRPEYLDELKKLCDAGFGDVDVHLHHHNDTPDRLRDKLEEFRETLAVRHGLLREDPRTGRIVYGFIHGNWALCNSRPDGHCCGVDQELTVLMETGCYADFTFPSAPSDTQPSTINSIYYARDIPGQSKSHDQGIRARVGNDGPADHLLMIQGPLSLNWKNRKWGVAPTIENADITGRNPPTMGRFQQWLRSGVHVAGKPEWVFIKLHTHGCKDANTGMLFGQPMQDFHAGLAEWHRRNPQYRYHYVTAWEMAQLVRAAERGEAIESVLKPVDAPSATSLRSSPVALS